MIRIVLMGICVFASHVVAQTTRPGLIGATPTTQPSIDELHAQAVELMRAKRYAPASAVFEQVWRATPPPQRTRPMILNRAILDLTQKKFVMRGVKELGDYLVKHREEDEFATNVLGALLNLAADDAKVKHGPVWQSAYKEWERRDYILNRSRPGWHRWGTKWLDEQEYAALQERKKAHDDALVTQHELVNRLWWNVGAKRAVYNEYVRTMPVRGTSPYHVNTPTDVPIGPAGDTELQRALREVNAVTIEYEFEYQRLMQMQKELIRPDWPATFEPVDPAELSPPPPPEMPPPVLKPINPANPFERPVH